MYNLTERCVLLREQAVKQKSYQHNYDMQRNVYFTIGYANSILKDKDSEEVVSDAITYVLEKFKPFISPKELIVGFNFGDTEYGEKYMPQNNEKDIAIMKQNGISEEDIARYFDVYDKGYCIKRRGKVELSQEEIQAQKEWAAIGCCMASNHSVIGYEKGFYTLSVCTL